MPQSAAERNRRKRRHAKGDHSMCDPERRCEARDQAETCEAVASRVLLPAAGYGPRGAALRAEMVDAELGPLHRVLLDEAARMADRLDRLDAALERKGEWLRQELADGGSIVIVVDNALGEARQQAATLKALIVEIRAVLPKPVSKPARAPRATASGSQTTSGGLSDLTGRISARRRASAG